MCQAKCWTTAAGGCRAQKVENRAEFWGDWKSASRREPLITLHLMGKSRRIAQARIVRRLQQNAQERRVRSVDHGTQRGKDWGGTGVTSFRSAPFSQYT
jgi:hypothetical protein